MKNSGSRLLALAQRFNLSSSRSKSRKIVQRKAGKRRTLQMELLENRRVMAGDITGVVFDDLNANGADDPEDNGLPGWTVFVDTNKNGAFNAGEPTTVTDVKGRYEFLGLPAGSTTVYEVPQDGYSPTPGFTDHQTVNVRNGKETRLKFPNVTAPITTGSIVGTVFEDNNENLIKESGEHGLENWTVFIDVNGDGLLSASDPSTTTDADGDYVFADITAGPATVYEIPQGGILPTVGGLFPRNGAIDHRTVNVVIGSSVRANFSNITPQIGTIQGTVWNDLNGDGLQNGSETAIAGRTIFVDLNANGSQDAGEPVRTTDETGKYSIVDIRSAAYHITTVLPAGWISADNRSSDVSTFLSVGQTKTVDYFALVPTTGSISGVLWNDLDGNGLIGASEPTLAGWQVYVDRNGNGALDAGEPSTSTDATGAYTFVAQPYGNNLVREVVPSDWATTNTPAGTQNVHLLNGEDRSGVNFGTRERRGTIQGTLWNDANGDGLRGTSESPLSSWTVYLDLNNNGAIDASEPTALTDTAGAYVFNRVLEGTYKVTESIPSGWISTIGMPSSFNVSVVTAGIHKADFFALVPTTGTIQGKVWSDVNSNGIMEATEPPLDAWQIYLDLNSNNVLDAGEPTTTTDANGVYAIAEVAYGNRVLRSINQVGYTPTNPPTSTYSLFILNGENRAGVNFGIHEITDFVISGNAFVDSDKDGVRAATERGLSGITVYLDTNNNGSLDAGEPTTVTSLDLFFTPTVNEAGNYSFTHLARGTYHVREVLPVELDATPLANRELTLAIGPSGVPGTDANFANQFRANEIHGVVFDDTDGDHSRGPSEGARSGVSVYIDLNRNDSWELDEPTTETGIDGSYSFVGLTPGAYVVREHSSYTAPHTYPTTGGGVLWPAGTDHAPVGNVTPTKITAALSDGESLTKTVSLTLPGAGGVTNLVDVFLLFDDTGSFTSNSPIVRAAFPTIISSLQASLPGIDLGFGVGRFEEYGSFGGENSTGRPFTLNQPIISASRTGFSTSIQSALDRMAPGFGGDGPETDIEALYQLVTGLGFDGNNNGTTSESGAAGLAATQLTPGNSGDVPSFSSFTADPTNNVLSADGSIGGAGFRPGALPVILTATDIGFAYQPKGETSVTGVGGVSLPLGSLTQSSRGSTPFSSGAGLQETVTGLNALGALVIGLGTNPEATFDPRQGLESLATLTGAVNRSTTTISNGTTDPIAPGDPFYFQIGTGFGTTVADGVTNAIQNAVTNVALDITMRASDPRVRIINHTGTLAGIGAGQTATFDIEFVGDGRPHRFDLQFVRAGTNVVVGSIPVELGANIVGDGYQYQELEEGEIHKSAHFGNYVANVAPSFASGGDVSKLQDSGAQSIAGWATSINPGSASETAQVINFIVTSDNPTLFAVAPSIASDGTLTFTPAAGAIGSATVTVMAHDNGGIGPGGADTSAPQTFQIQVTSSNSAPIASNDNYSASEDAALVIESAAGLIANDVDAESSPLTATLVTGPAHGSLVLSADGSFTYTGASNYNGPDSFTYRVNDGSLDSNISTVLITVVAVNDAPVASNNSYTTREDVRITSVLPGVLAGDTDIDSSSLTASVVTKPAHGTLTLNADGSFLYVPTLNYNGLDTFTYQANDGFALSNIATVTITLTAVNDAPLGVRDSYAVDANTILNIAGKGVLTNDSDPEGSLFTAVLVAAPTHGTLALNASGAFTYTPAVDYVGTDSFTYRATEGTLKSAITTVSLTVLGSGTKFFVVDGTSLSTTRYNPTGTNNGATLLDKAETVPRGIASNADGSIQWVVDISGKVFIYDKNNVLLGTWTAVGVGRPEGITVWGDDLFIVDPVSDKVFTFLGGANLRTGSTTPSSSFLLNKSNLNSTDIVADASHFWLVNNTATVDRVFRYTRAGVLEGSWAISATNTSPTGITLDPTNVNHLWIVDSLADKVFQYDAATTRIIGTQEPSTVFPLALTNANPQGIADPLSIAPERSRGTTKVESESASKKKPSIDTVVAPLARLTGNDYRRATDDIMHHLAGDDRGAISSSDDSFPLVNIIQNKSMVPSRISDESKKQSTSEIRKTSTGRGSRELEPEHRNGVHHDHVLTHELWAN